MFILTQILSFIAMMINIIAVQLKTKKQILLTIVVANLLFIISYILLEAYMGALTCGIVAIEIIINTILEDKGKATPKIFIILYLVIFILLGVISFGSFIDTLPIIASILFTVTLIQTQEKYVRLLILGNLLSWIIYDFFVRAYLAVISDLFIISSTIIGIIRYEIKKEEKMKKVKVLKANKNHKEFIIHANQVINNVNETQQTDRLKNNMDKDYFCNEPKFHCLVAEIDNKPVGMILYSYFYWANDGEVLWISQMFVEEEYRKYGVFFKLIEKLKCENPDIKIVSCATSHENKRMQKILQYYGMNEINLKFYYKKQKEKTKNIQKIKLYKEES